MLIKKKLSETAVHLPKIMIPSEDIDLTKWCVIACDQYTSDLNYWERVYKYVGRAPSTLKLILPEVFLETPDSRKMIKKISKEMKRYTRLKVLKTLEEGFIYVRRTTPYGNVRNGLIACVDLEKYSYLSADSLIRPTEDTIMDRIPPRLEIREKSSLELTHILLMIDDPSKSIIEPLEMCRNNLKKIYDVKLMENGGQVEGYYIYSTESISRISNQLATLASRNSFTSRYNTDKSTLLFAVGDGNHSIACAKQHWQNIKSTLSEAEALSHPARFVLVEIVNIHDKGLIFHPIHRILKNFNIEDTINEIKSSMKAEISELEDYTQAEKVLSQESERKDLHMFSLISNKKAWLVKVSGSKHNLCAGTVQSFIDRLCEIKKVSVDYIHDSEMLFDLSKDQSTGILLPPVNKNGFFKAIIEEGPMPVKTFSIGHADEKRFYLEARKINS